MVQGKVNAALRYLSHNTNGGILAMDEIVEGSNGQSARNVLKESNQPRNQHQTRRFFKDQSMTYQQLYLTRLMEMPSNEQLYELKAPAVHLKWTLMLGVVFVAHLVVNRLSYATP